MPSIINLEEENPKFDIWSSDSIVMFGKIEPWSVSQFRTYGNPLIQWVLN